MKNNLKLAVLAAVVLLASCSTEETTVTNTENDQMAEVLENTPLQANTVSDNVVIGGGTKNEGMPPAPNEAIALDVSSSSQTALLGEGFDISLNSDANITGAYLQFKSNDGTFADSYYDIDLGANVSNVKFTGNHKLTKIRPSSIAKTDEETTVDVDFNTVIEPGTFCYAVCVYDAEGNISAPQEVCVTVESWGGNSSLVGKWELTKEEETYQNETQVFEVGVPFCSDQPVTCENQEQEINVSVCYTQEYGRMEFNSDGTFTLDFSALDERLRYEASASACEPLKNEETFRFQVEGNWAYVNDESRLVLIGYGWITFENGETTEEVFGPGEAEAAFDGMAEIDGNTFTITEMFDDDGDGVVEEVYKVFFERE